MTQLTFDFYEQDEQTDDLQGAPTCPDAIGLLKQPIPPCTGYEADYERVEQFERRMETSYGV